MLFLARGLVRCLSLTVSAILSSLSAAAFITLALAFAGDTASLREDEFLLFAGIGITITGWWFLWQPLLGPLLLAFLVTELGRLQSLIWHALIGGLVALAAAFQAQKTVSLAQLQADPALARDWLVLMSAGFVGGFVHWLIAGHRAGKWMGGPKET